MGIRIAKYVGVFVGESLAGFGLFKLFQRGLDKAKPAIKAKAESVKSWMADRKLGTYERYIKNGYK